MPPMSREDREIRVHAASLAKAIGAKYGASVNKKNERKILKKALKDLRQIIRDVQPTMGATYDPYQRPHANIYMEDTDA